MKKWYSLLFMLACTRIAYGQEHSDLSAPDFGSRISQARWALSRANDSMGQVETNDSSFLAPRLKLNLANDELQSSPVSEKEVWAALQTVQAERDLIEARKLDKRHPLLAPLVDVNDAAERLNDTARKLNAALPPAENQERGVGKCQFETEERSAVKVFYATDRKASLIPPIAFGSEEGNPGLSFGFSTVRVALNHNVGELSDFVIRDPAAETEDEFYRALSDSMDGSRDRRVLVFIHGFDVQFNDALRRTAQIAYDLHFCGLPVLYSWPSHGGPLGLLYYGADEEESAWTESHLRNFLEQLAKRSGGAQIHILAHSLGNRALVNALQTAQSETKFTHIVLAAPDVRKSIFFQKIAAVEAHSSRVTLYVSSKDRALFLSELLHHGSRAGDSDPEKDMVVVNGTDTIDVSQLSTNLTGHSYYGDNRSFLSDFSYLLRGIATEDRFGLRRVTNPPPHYKFMP